jgi:hypothetical protein
MAEEVRRKWDADGVDYLEEELELLRLLYGIFYRLQQFGFSTAETNSAWILRG